MLTPSHAHYDLDAVPDVAPDEYEQRRRQHAQQVATMLATPPGMTLKRARRAFAHRHRKVAAFAPEPGYTPKETDHRAGHEPGRYSKMEHSVIAILPNGDREIYPSTSFAAKRVGLRDPSPIVHCLAGRAMTAAGRKWQRVNESSHRECGAPAASRKLILAKGQFGREQRETFNTGNRL